MGLLLCCCCAVPALAADAAPSSVWDGVYSEAQALRGVQVFEKSCQSCHAADMSGGPVAAGLFGLGFQYLWKDKSLADIYSAMRSKMPPGSPASLPDQTYADLLAAILQRNQFPAGASEMTPDLESLQAIRITWDKPEKP